VDGVEASGVAHPGGTPSRVLAGAGGVYRAHPFTDGEVDEPDLLEASEQLRRQLEVLDLGLDLPGVQSARAEREGLIRQFDDYLLSRLRRLDAPLLAVVGGSTGAGKSTLVNSLVRRVVTRSGVLRPTTRSPVLVHHPYDAAAFASTRILPSLARVTSEGPDPVQPIDIDAPRITALRLVPDPCMPPGLAVIDAPDIDSVVETNRELAVQLLSAADLWLFVTTAARYADALPWQMLNRAMERGTSVAVVLDRVPPPVIQEVQAHLARMLHDRGLADSPMFVIPETSIEEQALLPQPVVAPLSSWLARLARDARTRAVVVNRTLAGALESLPERVGSLAAAADAQWAAERALRGSLDEVYAEAAARAAAALSDGSLLRGEVLARWQEFLGTGDSVATAGRGSGRRRARRRVRLRARPAAPSSEPLAGALRTSVESMVRRQAQTAVEAGMLQWRVRPGGAGLLTGHPDLEVLSEGFERELIHQIRHWEISVMELVRNESLGRRGSARIASLGVEGTAALLMVLAYGPVGGVGGCVGGGDVEIAAGTAAAAQRLLEVIFGDHVTGSLASKARNDLLLRIDHLLDGERQRPEALLGASRGRQGRALALRAAVHEIEGAG